VEGLKSRKQACPRIQEDEKKMAVDAFINKVSPQNFQKIIDAITKTLMPLASDKDKAFDLVKEFPDNGMAYGHLAHSLYISGGEKKKSIELYKHSDQMIGWVRANRCCSGFCPRESGNATTPLVFRLTQLC
jgi:hypothetical protein